MKTRLWLRNILVVVVLIITGCKEIKGDKGDNGPVGPSGNANVKSFQFTVTLLNWIDGGTGVIYFDNQLL